MGKIHRYYTKEDMKLLECAGKLLEAGITLDEIKSILPEILQIKEKKIKVQGEVVAEDVKLETKRDENIITTLDEILVSNNKRIEEGVTQMVTESLKKEISYLLLAKDQVEEERFKRLDTLIRQQQVFRKECGKRKVGIIMKEVLGFTG